MEKELIGKTIKNAEVKGHSEKCDGVNVLVLTMEDGSIFYVVGGYGGYTGKSCDEYPEYIVVKKDTPLERSSGNFPE